MRLKLSKNEALEKLLFVISRGYVILQKVSSQYTLAIRTKRLKENVTNISKEVITWRKSTKEELLNIFPSSMEHNMFVMANELSDRLVSRSNGNYTWDNYVNSITAEIKALHKILKEQLDFYSDLPISDRVYLEDIDSFFKVRSINPSLVKEYLNKGRIELSEDFVQVCLEQILDVPFHKNDWGGEMNDLYTANLIINGKRRQSAFLLKGKGLKSSEMKIADCGKNGDQIIRLFQTTADLYVVQYIGPISENVVQSIQTHVDSEKTKGRIVNYLVIDGQDTARLLKAYNKL